MQRFALFSLTNKASSYIKLARFLNNNGIIILATEGTYRFLKDNKISVLPTSKITGFSSLLFDKVKTLNHVIHSMILCDRENKDELKEIESYGLIDYVVVNLYETKYNNIEDFLKSLDIGGRTLINSAIKNFKYVTLIVDEESCAEVLKELSENKEISIETRKRLALKGFEYLLNYEAKAYSYLYENFTQMLSLFILLKEGKKLKYGENPHQKAYIFKNVEDESF